jgi:O-6-methylguanine DNA methyltransferase
MAVRCLTYEAEGWGVGELWLEDGRVVWHELPFPRPAMRVPPNSPKGAETPPADSVARTRARRCDGSAPEVELLARLRAYFAGEPVAFDDVDLDLEYGTAFHESCARALRAVPRGEVVTYGELAALAGAPNAARAAGSFCARNRLGLFVPCHRVVSADGLGSYGSFGLDYKRRLLALEGVAL